MERDPIDDTDDDDADAVDPRTLRKAAASGDELAQWAVRTAEEVRAGEELSWSSHHFSLSNPGGDGASDLPRLLRRLADAIEERGIDAMEILDLTVHCEMTAEGPWWSSTV